MRSLTISLGVIGILLPLLQPIIIRINTCVKFYLLLISSLKLYVSEILYSSSIPSLSYTDHDVFVPHHELTDESFLALAGFKLQYNENGIYPAGNSSKTSHFCFIAKSPDIILHPDWNEKCVRSAAHSMDLVKYDKSIPQKERNHSVQCINKSVKKHVMLAFL